MAINIIDTIAENLAKLDGNPDLAINSPKIFSKNGIILETYAKQNKISPDVLKKLVENNSFFMLGTSTIKTGLFSKTDKDIVTIQWQKQDVLNGLYKKAPEKILKESAGSEILLKKMLFLISDEHSTSEFKLKSIKKKNEYDYPHEEKTKLYKKYFPDELVKYQHEGRRESELEKKFKKRMPKGSEFHFSNGKVANSLMTWVQCIHMADNDVIVFHIKENDFYDWLENKVKAPELARICLMVLKGLQNQEISEKNVKQDLLLKINNTTLNNVIYEILIYPLIRSLKSNDQSKVQDAIDRLINIGDSRVVEPLMDKILDSSPQSRQKIITGLGKIGDKRVTPTLMKILKHSNDTQDKLLVLKTLGTLKDKRAVNTLIDIAKNNDEIGIEAIKLLDSIFNIKIE